MKTRTRASVYSQDRFETEFFFHAILDLIVFYRFCASLLQCTCDYFLHHSFLNVFPVSYFYLHQLPAQMGSLLGSSLALQYLDFVQDESALLRLNFWLGYALYEGKGGEGGEETTKLLWRLLSGRLTQRKDLGLNPNTLPSWHIKEILCERV